MAYGFEEVRKLNRTPVMLAGASILTLQTKAMLQRSGMHVRSDGTCGVAI